MPQQLLFHPITITSTSPQQINRAVNSYIVQVRQSLAQIIVSLQSDQLLQQMRNDNTLYEQKMTYILQLIHTHFKPQPINVKLTQQLSQMHQKYQLLQTNLHQSQRNLQQSQMNLQQSQRKITQLQSKLQQSKDEYISELNNIELQYKQFLVEKQTQQKQMTITLQHKQETLIKQKHQIQSLTIQFNKLKSTFQKQVQFLHQKLLAQNKILQQANAKLKMYEQENARIKLYEEDNAKVKLDQDKIVNIQHIQKDNSQQQSAYKITQFQNYILQLQSQITTLNQQLTTNQQHCTQLQQSLNALHHQQDQYKSTIQQMKQHMFLIKQQWEKKCLSIQQELSQQYHQRVIQIEQKMRQQLNGYVSEMNQGRMVVIQSSQQVMESKRLVMQRKYDQRIKQIEQQYNIKLNNQLQQVKTTQTQLQSKQHQFKQLQHKFNQTLTHLQQMQSQSTNKQHSLKQIIANLQATLTQTNKQHNIYEQQMNNKLSQLKQQYEKQIERLRKTQVMLLKDIKQQKLQKQSTQKQLITFKDQLLTIKQTHLHQSAKLKQLQSINQNQHTKILQLKKDLTIMNQKTILDQKSLKDKNQQIYRLENHVNQLKIQCKEIDNVKRKLDLKLAECIVRVKENQRVKSEMAHKVEKAYLLVRKLSKQLSMVKQDIHFQINSQKTKLQTITMQLSQQLSLRQDSIKYNYKLKTQQLLEQVQNEKTQQRRQLQEIIRENNNMKKQIKLLEQVMREKDQDHMYQKQRLVSLQVEKCRVFMQQEVDRGKEEKRKLEEKIYNQHKKHQYLITKTEKQVYKNIQLFISKWQHKLASSQQTLQINQNTVKQLNRQLKIYDSEIKDLRNQIKQKDKNLAKLQKKYQMLKQQRDKTVDEMMRRLQKQTKHKLSLERQMKEVRGEVMMTQPYTTTNNSPFNNYSFTDRQNAIVYTNAFQPTTHVKATKTQIKATNRQKELSQIREMIAKTYKVVQGPQKGSPVHKGKLF